MGHLIDVWRGWARPLAITIVIITLGLLLWALHVFVTTQSCLPPSDVWRYPSRLPLLTTFAVAFSLVLLWNIAEWISSVLRGKNDWPLYLANTIALVLIGYTLFRMDSFIDDYDAAMLDSTEWFQQQRGYGTSRNHCREAKQFWGEWVVVRVTADSQLLVKGLTLDLRRDRSFELSAPVTKAPIVGKWQYYDQDNFFALETSAEYLTWKLELSNDQIVLRSFNFYSEELELSASEVVLERPD